ncbi:MAG TPA: YeeE/YedE thiosulfate transporter family protein, partial [Thermodesulfovibrionales bacterium]|nr:YeeE/YedE thiosulfate transporter family protein [Thermodesulfovibrionales bacterium]
FDKGEHMGNTARLLTAFGGGIMIGFASRLARGCTSGVALSGGAQLALAGWIFVIAMFISGFVGAALFRRLWS